MFCVDSVQNVSDVLPATLRALGNERCSVVRKIPNEVERISVEFADAEHHGNALIRSEEPRRDRYRDLTKGEGANLRFLILSDLFDLGGKMANGFDHFRE